MKDDNWHRIASSLGVGDKIAFLGRGANNPGWQILKVERMTGSTFFCRNRHGTTTRVRRKDGLVVSSGGFGSPKSYCSPFDESMQAMNRRLAVKLWREGPALKRDIEALTEEQAMKVFEAVQGFLEENRAMKEAA